MDQEDKKDDGKKIEEGQCAVRWKRQIMRRLNESCVVKSWKYASFLYSTCAILLISGARKNTFELAETMTEIAAIARFAYMIEIPPRPDRWHPHNTTNKRLATVAMLLVC